MIRLLHGRTLTLACNCHDALRCLLLPCLIDDVGDVAD